MRKLNEVKVARELVKLAKQLQGADTFECPNCGTKVLDSTKYCVKCKKKVAGNRKEYQEYFNGLMDEFNIDSPAELSEEKKKEFFNKVDKGWGGKKEANVFETRNATSRKKKAFKENVNTSIVFYEDDFKNSSMWENLLETLGADKGSSSWGDDVDAVTVRIRGYEIG